MGLPLEVHAYWHLSPEEYGKEYEWRLVFVTEDGSTATKETFPLKSDNPRYRVRVHGFPVLRLGKSMLKVEWRPAGGKTWKRCAAFWPVIVEFSAKKPERQAGSVKRSRRRS